MLMSIIDCVIGIEPDESRYHPEYRARYRRPSRGAGSVLCPRRPLIVDAPLL